MGSLNHVISNAENVYQVEQMKCNNVLNVMIIINYCLMEIALIYVHILIHLIMKEYV